MDLERKTKAKNPDRRIQTSGRAGFIVDGRPARAVDMFRLATSFHAKSDDGAITIEQAAWALSEYGYCVEARRNT